MRWLAFAVMSLSLVVGLAVDRDLHATPPPARAPVPLSAPAKACVLRAVDCTNDKDEHEQAQCVALALSGGPAVVVHSKDQPRTFLVVVWAASCK